MGCSIWYVSKQFSPTHVANHFIRRFDFRSNSGPGCGCAQLSACRRSFAGQAFSDLLRSTILGHTQTVYFSVTLPFCQSDIQADLAGRASLHSWGTMTNGVSVDASSTKRSVPSLRSSFVQC